MVFDLNTGQTVRKEYLGAVRVESDSRGFPAPAWDAAGTGVTFEADHARRSIKPGLNKITLSFR